MISYIKNIMEVLLSIVRSKYALITILYVIWLYRIEFMPDTGGGVAKAVQVFSLLCIAFLLFRYNGNIVTKCLNKSNAPIKSELILYIFALISTSWALLPQFAFFISFQNIIMIMAVFWMLTLSDDFKSTEKTFVYFVLLTVLFENIAIRLTAQKVLIAHFLPAASSAAMLFVYSLGEYLSIGGKDVKRKSFLRNTALCSACLLIVNTSGGANSSALFAIGVALWLSRKYFMAFAVTVTAVFILTNQDLLTDIILTLMPDKNIEQIETGNGRQEIWDMLLKAASEKPYIGWGFACVERTVGSIFEDQTLSDAHNNYIGMYGSLGIVGLILFVFHYFVQLLFSLRRIKRPGFVGIICATACAMVNGYSYGFMSGKTCSITVVYFAIVALTFAYSRLRFYDKQAV